MNKLEQLRVIGRSLSKLIDRTNNISIKINNTKEKSKRDILFKKLRLLNHKKMFLHKLYFTIYNS